MNDQKDRQAGRPEKPIDWKRVDELLEAGCPGTEIAPHFDIHHDTFYERVQKKWGITFTDYAYGKREKGAGLLRERQYKKALRGDNTQLIWLGKVRLGQKENTANTELNLATLVKWIESGLLSQKENLK